MTHEKCRVLLIYHGAYLEPSRRMFEALSKQKDIRLRVLAPRRGYNRAREQVVEITRPYCGEYELVTGRVYKAMRDYSGPYIGGLLREMRRFRPHVIHVMNEPFSMLHLQTLIFRNLFLRHAKVFFFGFENVLAPWTSTKWRWIWKFISRNSDGGAFANTEGLEAVAKLGYPAEKLILTYWGVPLQEFKPARNQSLRNELRIFDHFVVGYVGRVLPEKGLATILHALKHLPDSVHFLCLGDGTWRNSLLENVRALGLASRFHWIPRVQDTEVPLYLNALDALILPSETTTCWKEQFGRVLAEAMACGVPVIGSSSGAIPEVIGAAGKVFPEGDSKALAAAIRALFENPALYQRLVNEGITRASKYFSCEAFAWNLTRLYLRST